MRRINFTVSILLLLFAGATAAWGQEKPKPNMTTEDFRKQAPTPLAPRPIRLPKPVEYVLPNGLKVVVVADKRLPLVSYRLAFPGGTARDADAGGTLGLTDMLTSMLTEGTETRSSKQIADEVARLGASLSASANLDYTVVSASSLANYNDEVLKLLADVALHPAFSEKELGLNKANAIQGLQFQRSQPDFLARERTARVLYGDAPYGTVSATPEAIEAITREKLIAAHRAKFAPQSATLFVVGNVQPDALKKQIETSFGAWSGPAPSSGWRFRELPEPRSSREIYLIDRPGSQQSNIVIGNLAIKRTDPDYFSLLVMNQVLGAGASSRLFMNLREAKGYTYGAYSNLDARQQAGTFQATSEVRTPVTGAALKEFFYELDRIRTEPVSDKELSDAKAYLTGVFPLQLETQEGLIDRLVTIRMMGLPADYLDTYRDKVNAVTAADIERVAKQYVTPDKAAVVIVGDESAIIDQIKPYSSKIEFYDTSGKRKEANSTVVSTGPVSFPGTWNLTISAPGQSLPATLILKQDGENLSGSVESQMGPGTISNLTTTGNKFDGTLTFTMQGRAMEMKVNGTVNGDKIDGSIVPNFQGVPPFPFTGTRAKP
jgi:zinc protease